MQSLTKIEWYILLTLMDDYIEPFESIDKSVMEIDKSITPLKTLELLFRLEKAKYITVKQEPIEAFGQKFNTKIIVPQKKEDIIGDLYEPFQKYISKRDWLQRYKNGGIPFGIYFKITESGIEEYNRLKNQYSE